LDRATLTAIATPPATSAAITRYVTAVMMKCITEPTIRNAISMPTPMAATLNQRIRRILSRQGTVLSRYYPTLAQRRAGAGPNRPLR
jgi:hypothetical protein